MSNNVSHEGVFLKDSLGDAINSINPLNVSEQVWRNIKYDASDSQPNYIGLNLDADALDSDSDWEIFKFTYSGSNVTQILRKTGTWSGRVALFS